MAIKPTVESLDPLEVRNGGATLERPWLQRYPAGVPTAVEFPSLPAWTLLEAATRTIPDRVACRYYHQQKTYSEWWRDAQRAAIVLQHAGVRPGDRVAVLLPNCPEYVSVLHGIWLAGGVAVSLSPLMVPCEISALLKTTNCRVAVGLDVLAPLLRKADARLDRTFYVSIGDRLPLWQLPAYALARMVKLGFGQPIGRAGEDWLDLEAVDVDGFSAADREGDDPAFILPTGGTTGNPKAVTLSHRNLLANARQLESWCGCRHGRDTVLAILPFFHAYGLSTCAMTAIASGATIVMHHRFVPKIVHRLLEQHEPAMFPAVPRVLAEMNAYFRKRPIRRHCVTYVVSGGAPLDPAIAEEFERHTGARVVEGYGLSEASPVTHTGPLDDTARPGTIGLPLPGTDARIVDPETGTRTLGPNEVGELVVRGPQVMSGYWENAEATGHVVREGWLHTGDLAKMDSDGFFTIVDRMKDLVIVSGFNVHPSDVEAVLRQHADVADCAVVGVQDARTGEAVKAFVQLEPGRLTTAESITGFAASRLSKHKRPTSVEFVDDLPRNFLGKVLRRELREREVTPTTGGAP